MTEYHWILTIVLGSVGYEVKWSLPSFSDGLFFDFRGSIHRRSSIDTPNEDGSNMFQTYDHVDCNEGLKLRVSIWQYI